MSSPTIAERIGRFTDQARAAHLTPASRELFKRNILDSLGCAIAALPGKPFAALREQAREYGIDGGSCSLIGGGSAAPDQAALYNSGLVRYVDLLDSYMSPGGLCHPSDNFGAILAAAQHARASGADFMLALAVAYEIGCRITAIVPVMAKGFNHAIQLAMSSAAGAGKLFGLNAGQIAHAIAIAAVDNVSLSCVHSEPVSQWKGFSPGITGMRAVYAASLAKRGFTGPLRLFEGPNGLERMFGQSLDLDWEDPSLDVVHQTVMKKYCSLIHGQPVLEATLDLKRRNGLRAEDISGVQCDIFQSGYDIAGGGSFGDKDHPQTKEQADYNLKYLIAVALLDDQVGPAQLEPARVQAADVQALLREVTVCPDARFSEQYPHALNTRITFRCHDGRVLVEEHTGFEGGLDNPFTWQRTVEKFNWLSERYANQDLREQIVELVSELDRYAIDDLMQLLAKVSPEARFPARHPGIQ
ncbi:2-methylcitrate dehydratase [Burkholderia cepacia]|nr:2-methylcitrate dehydratase [Burkholderia cepacia]